jgi:acyl-CoA dehydrogenase
MQLSTPNLAREAGAAAREAFARAGGVSLARRAEVDPSLRDREVGRLVEASGLNELRVRDGVDDLVAAGEVCRAAGAVALPYPLVSMLATPPGFAALIILPPGGSRADHADLLRPAVGIEISGGHRAIASAALAAVGRLAPFVADVRLGEPVDTGSDSALDAAIWLVLSAWWVLGAAERALALTIKHVNEREQFGAPLSHLQSVRFRIADAAVLIRGLAELARYSTWRLYGHPEDAPTDALSLRVVAQETAQATFRTAHQLHGATGFCDEHDLSILSRHVQPYLRLPLDHEHSVAILVEQMDRDGFEGLFGRYR